MYLGDSRHFRVQHWKAMVERKSLSKSTNHRIYIDWCKWLALCKFARKSPRQRAPEMKKEKILVICITFFFWSNPRLHTTSHINSKTLSLPTYLNSVPAICNRDGLNSGDYRDRPQACFVCLLLYFARCGFGIPLDRLHVFLIKKEQNQKEYLLITKRIYLLLRQRLEKNQFIANVSCRFADFRQLTGAAIIHTKHSLCCQ